MHEADKNYFLSSTISPGFTALRGEIEKDAQYKDLVEAAGGGFLPLVVDSFGHLQA